MVLLIEVEDPCALRPASWSLEGLPRVRILAGFLVDLVLPLATFGGTEIDEFAADGDKYGEEGVFRNSFRLEELSSSGTLLRPRLESIGDD